VWLACVLASCPFFLDLPLIVHLREVTGKHFWSPPHWTMVFTTYSDYLGLNWTLALVFIIFFGITVVYSLLRMLRRLGDGSLERDFCLPEVILVGGFLFYPALLVALTKLLSNSGYTSRYGWPAILGLVLGSVYLVRPIWFKSSSAYLLMALLIVFAVQEGIDFRIIYKAGSTRLHERWTKLVELSRDETCIPIVIGSGHRYLEAAEYAPPELRDRLVGVVDEDIATRLVGSDIVDKTNRLLAQFIPLRVEDLAAFQTADRKFILYSGGNWDWFTQYLVESRYHLRLLSIDAGGSIYIVER
jgi:hypothetical protein